MKKILITYLMMPALLLTLLAGCLYDGVEMTDDGEPGVDPTMVNLRLKLTLKQPIPSFSEGGETWVRPPLASDAQYRHRIVIEAYEKRVLAHRMVTYADLAAEEESTLTLPVAVKLHARHYEIAVWHDFVAVPTPDADGVVNDDYFWDTNSEHLVTVLCAPGYYGSNVYKDAFCGRANVDLRQFRNQWGAQLTLPLELKRPVARYELLTDDVARFVQQVTKRDLPTDRITVRVKYNTFLNTGYNVLEWLPRQGMQSMQYEKTIRVADLAGLSSLPIAFDYVLTDRDKVTNLPVSLDVTDDAGKVLSYLHFTIGVKAGTNRVITHGFLTASSNGGVDFNPDFDQEVDIEVPGEIIPHL